MSHHTISAGHTFPNVNKIGMHPKTVADPDGGSAAPPLKFDGKCCCFLSHFVSE